MAESEDGLGTVKILLEQVLEEVLYLKKILATPKEEELKLVDVHAPVLWYDEIAGSTRDYYENPTVWPQKNLSAYANDVVNPEDAKSDEKWLNKFGGTSEILHNYNIVGAPYKIRPIASWDEDEYRKTDNLYFIEVTQVHSYLNQFLAKMTPKVKDLIRRRQMACVFWFPHEGFSYKQQSNMKQMQEWMDVLHQSIINEELQNGIFALVYGDLNAEMNYDRYHAEKEITAIGEYPKFTAVVGYDFFNQLYFQEWTNRTCVRFNPKNEKFNGEWRQSAWTKDIFGVNNYSRWPECFIEIHNMPKEYQEKLKPLPVSPNLPHRKGRMSQINIDGSSQMLHHVEMLKGIPNAENKTRDLICLNARVRPHRSAMVSELFRLGYDNTNSRISFLARDQLIDDDGTYHWKNDIFRDIDPNKIKEVNHWLNDVTHDSTDIFSFRSQKKHFWDFWHEHNVIELENENSEMVDADDRVLSVEHYEETYFSLVSETLFAVDNECIQLTEKIYKPLAYCHPFMVMGSAGTLEYLKSIGYKTYPMMFDERYDTLKDPKERFGALVRNLEIWHALTDSEKKQRYNEALPVIKYNHEKFKNDTEGRRDRLLDVLQRIRPSTYGL